MGFKGLTLDSRVPPALLGFGLQNGSHLGPLRLVAQEFTTDPTVRILMPTKVPVLVHSLSLCSLAFPTSGGCAHAGGLVGQLLMTGPASLHRQQRLDCLRTGRGRL